MNRGYLKLVLVLLFLLGTSSMANAVGTSFGATINATEVILTYQTDAGTTKNVTNNAADITVNAVSGYFPTWPTVLTSGIEPGETTTFSYTFMNKGNTSDEFRVTFSIENYSSSNATSWNITVSTVNYSAFYPAAIWSLSGSTFNVLLGPDVECAFDLVITSSASVTPGAYAVISINIECSSNLSAAPYTGDNGNPYGGYGDASRNVTATIMLAVMTMTKTVTVNAPAGYIANGGLVSDAVPGARLDYTIAWANIGSQYASNVLFVDIIPTLNATLTGTATPFSLGAFGSSVSYNVSNAWTLTASHNASFIRVGYSSIPAGATGNITYSLIIK